MQKVLVLLGSNRPGRNGEKVARWFKDITNQRTDMEFEHVDIDDLQLPMYNEPRSPMEGNYQYDYTKRWSKKVADADAFVFITPEYNHGYPAVLKNAIDYLNHEWKHKPVGFISYGVNQGVRAVEQLCQVLRVLKMVPISTLPHVGFNIITEIDSQGNLLVHEGKAPAAQNMLDELKWWSEALSIARSKN